MRIILLLFLFIFANAFKMEAEYFAKYGWFGTIAKAKGVYEHNTTNYTISTSTKATGFVASLSNHLQQFYTSTGKIKNGFLVPDKYVVTIIRGGKNYKRVYIFDHKNKTIKKYMYDNFVLKKSKTLPYYAKEDVLTLYFNLPEHFKNNIGKTSFTFFAVGGRKNDGRIDVTFPSGDELKKIKHKFDNENGVYIKANLYNKVFAGDKGLLYLVIDPKNWVTTKGMVKNVLKIGDLKGGIKNFKLTP